MAPFRRPIALNPGAVQLLVPEDGSTTAPLQASYWLTDAEHEGADHAEGPVPGPIQWADLDAIAADRSQPAPVRFAGLPPPGGPRGMVFDLVLSSSPDLVPGFTLTDLTVPAAELLHLYLDRQYYWRVTARVGDVAVAASRVATFRTYAATPRWIRVPDTTNVRDLGGYVTRDGRRVRQGLLYRSAELNAHLRLTGEGRGVLLDQLGLRTDLDLRGPAERPSPALDPARVRWVSIPTLPYGFLAEADVRDAYRRIFELLADPGVYPLLFHCWGGADRAGTLAFLVSGLLGVPLDGLVRDYELTSLSVWGERFRDMPEFREMQAALRGFAGEGAPVQAQVEGYLHTIGVPQAHTDALRSSLLEEVE